MSHHNSKICIKCHLDQPIEMYYEHKNTCKLCLRIMNRIAVRRYKLTENGRRKQRASDNKYKHSLHGHVINRKHSHKRRELKRGLEHQFTADDYTAILELFHYKCFNCGSGQHLQIDHHYPLSRGYALNRQNAVVLCDRCNYSKYNRLPSDFYTSEQLLNLEQKYGIATL